MSDFNENVPTEFITKDGVYFFKITDACIFTSKTGQPILKVRFCTENMEVYDEILFINAKSLWKMNKFVHDIKLTKEEKADISFNKEHPEESLDVFQKFFEKHIVGKYVKMEILTSTYNSNYKVYGKIRQLTSADKQLTEGLRAVENKFPEMQEYEHPTYDPNDYPVTDDDTVVPF
ncbi:MAG: hypothetical protein FWG20_02160 [Candidatus Cloacimonetes bacterium]|nr:hypothetical protein [Candidatus Cloacimonadota bacterium]